MISRNYGEILRYLCIENNFKQHMGHTTVKDIHSKLIKYNNNKSLEQSNVYAHPNPNRVQRRCPNYISAQSPPNL
jgi:hypothetical protein